MQFLYDAVWLFMRFYMDLNLISNVDFNMILKWIFCDYKYVDLNDFECSRLYDYECWHLYDYERGSDMTTNMAVT